MIDIFESSPLFTKSINESTSPLYKFSFKSQFCNMYLTDAIVHVMYLFVLQSAFRNEKKTKYILAKAVARCTSGLIDL